MRRQRRELFQDDRKKIKLLSLFRRGKKGFFTANAYDGQCFMEKGTCKDNIPMKATGTADKEQARIIAEEWVEQLRHQWDLKYGGHKPKPGGQPRNLAEELHAILELMRREKGAENPTYKCLASDAEIDLNILVDHGARLPRDHTDKEFERLMKFRFAGLETNASYRTVVTRARQLFSLVPGLPKACLQAIRLPKRLPRQVKRETIFRWSDIAAMGRHLPHASNDARTLVLGGACMAQHISEIIFITWEMYDAWKKGMYSGHRRKTGALFQNFMWDLFMRGIDEKQRRPGDIYILFRVVFGIAELKDPNRNKRKLTPLEEQERAGSVEWRANRILTGFLNECGVKRPDITFKSFRSTAATLALAYGFPFQVVMDLLGISSLKTLMMYANSTHDQIEDLSRFLEKYWTQAFQGKKMKFVKSHTEAVDVLTSTFRTLLGAVRRESKSRLQSIEDKVSRLERKLDYFITLLEGGAAKN